MYLVLDSLTCRYGSRTALDALSLRVERGEFVAVVGPNGSGKSTLLRAVAGAIRPAAGRVLLDGREVHSLRGRERARQMAVVAQETSIEFDFTVEETVQMGRLSHQGPLGRESEADRLAVQQALELTGTIDLAGRAITRISGGERQRVILARALAQEPRLLLLDEPTAHLDLAFQTEIFDLVRSLNREQGLTVVAVLHDLNLAALYADRVVMLRGGETFADGPPRSVITEKNVAAVFGRPVRVIPHPEDGSPHVVLTSRVRPALVSAWAD